MNIPRYKPKIIQHIIAFIIIIATFSLSGNTLTVHAEDWNAGYVSSFVNSLGTSGNSSTSTVINGVMSTRTGYLCYMLTKDGSPVPGTTAKAFKSPGYNGIGGAKWLVKDRNGYYSVGSWSGDVSSYWGCTPFTSDSQTNEPKIKNWLATETPEGPNSCKFVEVNFGEEAVEGFINDDYVLVIETIMNFQYSISGGSSGSKDVTSSAEYRLAKTRIYAWSDGKLIQEAYDNGMRGLANRADEASGASRQSYIRQIRSSLLGAIEKELRSKYAEESGGNFTPVGDVVTGTVPNLVKYKQSIGHSTTAMDSYVNKKACFAERIQVSEAGFTAWNGSTSDKLSNSDVLNHGVAMMIVHCKGGTPTTGTHTWDSDKNPPGTGVEDKAPEPPSSSLPTERKFTIIKSYRVKDKTTGTLEDKGTFKKTQTVSTIRIEDEPLNDTDKNYKVIGWKQSSTDLPTSLNSINWESKVPQLILK